MESGSDPTQDGPQLEVGFTRVDDQPDPSLLTAGMDRTAQWPAVQTLRAWERERLALSPGQRLVDVGCGLGDVAIALAAQLAPDGEVVGIDASDAMLDVARSRVPDGCPVTFRRGDAVALDLPPDSFDACRSERMLQWLPDAAAATLEMVRVVRPGGRLVITDTDWRTLAVDLPDSEAADAVIGAVRAFRGPSAGVGGRLLNLLRDAGLEQLEVTAATHVWTEWDMSESSSIPGLFPMRAVVPQLVERDLVDVGLADRFIDDLERAARADRLCLTLTMLSVAGRAPD